MTSICIIHIIVWIYWPRNEHEDMVLRTVFYMFLSLWRHTHNACVSLVYNVKGELNVIGSVCIEHLVGGAALQVMAGTLQSTLRRLGIRLRRLEKGSNLSSLR